MVFEYSVKLFEYSLWEIMPQSVREIVSLSGYWYITRSIWGAESLVWVSITYLELGSLYMLHCFLTTVTQEEDPAFAYLNSEAYVLPVRRDVNMKVSTVP